MIYCCICHALDPDAPFNRDIVAVCNEILKPVCEKHANGCHQDGHGTSPLDEELTRRLTQSETETKGE